MDINLAMRAALAGFLATTMPMGDAAAQAAGYNVDSTAAQQASKPAAQPSRAQTASEPPRSAPIHRNGVGRDPDGDTNPATYTSLVTRIGDAAEAAFDPPYNVITFEGDSARHDDDITSEYADAFGVRFSAGLKRQICEGQRYFQYNSQCTYRRAPSGRYAAVYGDEFHRPLTVEFATPICAAAMAILPTGGEHGEEYEVTLRGYDDMGAKLDDASARFQWTENTFRWRHMAAAHFTGARASRIDVNVKSLNPAKRTSVIRFLIDDLAFVHTGCKTALGASTGS